MDPFYSYIYLAIGFFVAIKETKLYYQEHAWRHRIYYGIVMIFILSMFVWPLLIIKFVIARKNTRN